MVRKNNRNRRRPIKQVYYKPQLPWYLLDCNVCTIQNAFETRFDFRTKHFSYPHEDVDLFAIYDFQAKKLIKEGWMEYNSYGDEDGKSIEIPKRFFEEKLIEPFYYLINDQIYSLPVSKIEFNGFLQQMNTGLLKDINEIILSFIYATNSF